MPRFAILVILVGVRVTTCGDGDPAGLRVSCQEAQRTGDALAPSLVFEDGGLEFALGEPIRFSMSVTNCTDGRIVFEYPTAQRYEFTVSPTSDYPREVWAWSHGQAFGEVVSEETFEPGETKTYSETWDQRSNAGGQVPTGLYILTGDDLHCEANDAPPDCASGAAIVFEIK